MSSREPNSPRRGGALGAPATLLSDRNLWAVRDEPAAVLVAVDAFAGFAGPANQRTGGSSYHPADSGTLNVTGNGSPHRGATQPAYRGATFRRRAPAKD